MTPSEEAASPRRARSRTVVGRSPVGRLAALGALIIIVITVGYLLFASGDGGNNYKLVFETGGQLVKGNQVLIGGQPVGTIDDVKLTDNAQAEVVDHRRPPAARGHLSGDPLHLALGDRQPLHLDHARARQRSRSSATAASSPRSTRPRPVDLDQLFNTLREPERKALQDIIQGSAVYGGPTTSRGPHGAEDANETYKYLSPSLVATDRLLQELDRDERRAHRLPRQRRRRASARSPSAATTSPGWSPTRTRRSGAIASQNRGPRPLPGRPAAGAAPGQHHLLQPPRRPRRPRPAGRRPRRPATKNLAPFLRQLQAGGRRSPSRSSSDLRLAVDRRGKTTTSPMPPADLAPLESRASGRRSRPSRSPAMQQAPTDVLQFLRPYVARPLSALGGLGPSRRLLRRRRALRPRSPAGLGIFHYDTAAAGPILDADPDRRPDLRRLRRLRHRQHQVFRRCPGGATQPIAGSNPFSSPPVPAAPPASLRRPPGDCDATDVPPGP